jgi:hypothetical protein
MIAGLWAVCLYNPRIVIVHPVNICPNLYLFAADACAYQRCGVIAAAAAQVINFAKGIAANKALRYK